MDVYRSFEEFGRRGDACRASHPIVTVGSFDGLHLGHQALIRELQDWARKHDSQSLVMTFHTHPRTFMTGEEIKRIITVEHKLHLLASMGITNTLLIDFDKRLQSTGAEQFCAEYVRKLFNARGLLLGHNNRIGRGREGTPERVKDYGAKLGFEVRISQPVMLGEVPISSSAVRENIEAGNFARAGTMLGRAYSVCGVVQGGRKLGRTIGFPTINLALEGLAHPPYGVYGVRVALNGKHYPGAANVGVRPTVENDRATPLLEAHLLDYTGDCYGETVDVEFVFHVRPERKFATPADLRRQIEEDIATVRARFKNERDND